MGRSGIGTGGACAGASGANAGFTLIEVLVALIVLAVGLVGAAGTQLAALRMRHGSALMSDGVQLASGLADRMRANPQQGRLDDAHNPYASFHYSAVDGAPAAAGAVCLGEASCDSAALAEFDLDEVRAALFSSFPDGRMRVCRDATTTLNWDCSGGAGSPLVIKLGWRGKRVNGADDTDPAGASAPALMLVVDGA